MTHSGHVTRWFNNPLSNHGRYLLVIRAREFFIKLVKRAKEVALALKARFVALKGKVLSAVPVRKFPVPGISSETHNAMNVGKRHRLTQDHSPVFSLFTFFPDRL